MFETKFPLKLPFDTLNRELEFRRSEKFTSVEVSCPIVNDSIITSASTFSWKANRSTIERRAAKKYLAVPDTRSVKLKAMRTEAGDFWLMFTDRH